MRESELRNFIVNEDIGNALSHRNATLNDAGNSRGYYPTPEERKQAYQKQIQDLQNRRSSDALKAGAKAFFGYQPDLKNK